MPVTDDYVEGALRLAEAIPFRVDVDDRDVKLGKKIRDAEKEWIPYTLVVGEKELSGGTLTVRPRLGAQVEMSVDGSLRPFLERSHRSGCSGLPRHCYRLPCLGVSIR